MNNTTNNQENTKARITQPEKVRQIIEQYIDQVDATVNFDGGVFFPVCSSIKWRDESGFPDITTVLKIMKNPHGTQEINNMAKTAVKKYLRKYSLNDAFHYIRAEYGFKILRDAKEYISMDEFSQLLRATWEASNFYFCEDDAFSNDDLWELLQSCDSQKFMTSEEREVFLDGAPDRLFQGTDFTNPFVWTDSAAKLIIAADGRFGHVDRHRGYSAFIEDEDVFAVIFGLGEGTGYIVNPNKLEDVEAENDLRLYCERDELSEEDWDDDDDWGD